MSNSAYVILCFENKPVSQLDITYDDKPISLQLKCNNNCDIHDYKTVIIGFNRNGCNYTYCKKSSDIYSYICHAEVLFCDYYIPYDFTSAVIHYGAYISTTDTFCRTKYICDMLNLRKIETNIIRYCNKKEKGAVKERIIYFHELAPTIVSNFMYYIKQNMGYEKIIIKGRYNDICYNCKFTDVYGRIYLKTTEDVTEYNTAVLNNKNIVIHSSPDIHIKSTIKAIFDLDI